MQSKGDLCATGTASLPASVPGYSLVDYTAVAAVKERKPVNTGSYEVGKWLGSIPCDWAGEAAKEYLGDIREPIRSTRAKASVIPACCRGS